MILLLDTSTPLCKLTLLQGSETTHYDWQADRQLANGLLRFLSDKLALQGSSLQQVSAIGVFQGPGSFTGLRIGITVLNTIADTNGIPIVGVQGDNWQQLALEWLNAGENDRIVLPFYGREANITTPRK